MAIELTAGDIIRELDIRIRARVPITTVETHEELRFIRLLQVTRRQYHGKKDLYIWSATHGMRKLDFDGNVTQEYPDTDRAMEALTFISNLSKVEKDKPLPQALFVLCDFGPYLEPQSGYIEPVPTRALRELAWEIQGRHVNVFAVGHTFPRIASLEKEVHSLEMALPNEQEIAAMLDARLTGLKNDSRAKVNVSGETREEIIGALSGMTEAEAQHALAVASIRLGGLNADALPLLIEAKRDAIRADGSLEFLPPEPLTHWGGYERLIEMVHDAAATFRPEARDYPIEPHKGFLLAGIAGCGKSKLMQIISGVTNKPLIRMDMGAMFGSLVGQSEGNMRAALKRADALHPVLGIDEYEKVMSGAESSGKTDSGTTSRVAGTWLTWSAEQTGTLIVATANHVERLQPEDMRSGRMTLVWVGLPTWHERREIFKVHLAKRGRDANSFNLDALTDQADRFSGAEVEQAVKNGLLYGFRAGRQVTGADLARGISDILPTGKVNEKQIKTMEAYARDVLGAVDLSGESDDSITTQRAPLYSDERPIEIALRS